MTKSFYLILAAVFSFSQLSWAAISSSSITSMKITTYAMYFTSDATCQTGLVAAIPMSASPTAQDLATGPTLGSSANIPSSIKCVVIITKNGIGQTWSAGSYTGTTNSNNDSNCNAGGSLTYPVCRNVATLSYPSQIKTDAASAGVTLSTSCPSTATGNEIFPVYISTNSACSGDQTSTTDPSACYASGAYPNAFAAPTLTSDTSNGLKLTAPAASGTIYFVASPKNTIGGCGSVGSNCVSTTTGNCGAAYPPAFSFHN